MTAHFHQNTRTLYFECDFCGSLSGHKTGLPDGWMRVTTREHTVDGCPDCVSEMLENGVLREFINANNENVIVYHVEENESKNDR